MYLTIIFELNLLLCDKPQTFQHARNLRLFDHQYGICYFDKYANIKRSLDKYRFINGLLKFSILNSKSIGTGTKL